RRACIMMQEVYTVMHADYAHDRRRPASRGQRARGQGWGECQPACRGGDPVRVRPQGGPERVRQYIAADGRRPTSARHRPGQQCRPAGRHGASDVILCDVNVFIYAHKRGAPGHERYHQWLIDTLNHDEPVAVSDIVLSSFIRIVTHQRIFDPPSTLAEALSFATTVREHPNVLPIQPRTRRWGIVTRTCPDANTAGNRL